jgi:hypothetical protein
MQKDMVTRSLLIDGQEVIMKATALTPRLYRIKFGRDMMQDMDKLRAAYNEKATNGVDMSALDLTIFENLAYIMAKQAETEPEAPAVPDTPDEWLDQFGMFSLYEILPVMFDLWHVTTQTTSKSKKK